MAYNKNLWANGDTITADKLNHLENGVEAADTGGGLTDDIRAALIQLAAKVAYIDDDGAEYYGDLYDALYAVQSIYLNTNSILINTIGGTSQLTATTSPSGASVTWSSSDSTVATVSNSGLVTSVALGSCTITATAGSKTATCAVTVAQKTLSSISAVYTQSGTVYTTDSLDSLKSDLVVTAHWSDNTTSTVASTDYTLSGTLTAGTSTVTVSYGGKTTTFNVTVTAAPTLSSISAVYTQSGTVYDTDSLDSLKTDLVVTAHYSDTSTATVPSTDYTLSGTLEAGTSTVTVTYQSKTTTFTVTVTGTSGWVNNTITLTSSDIVQGQITSTSPYLLSSNANRISYIGFDITASVNYTYTFTYTTDLATTNIGIQWITPTGITTIENQGDMGTVLAGGQNANRGDTGWQSSGYVFNAGTTPQNGISCFWLTFRAGTGSTAISPSNIQSVTITRTPISPGTLLYNWDLTQSLTDSVNAVTATLNAGSGVNQPTRSASGLTFDAATQNIYFGQYGMTGRTLEVDVASFNFAGDSSKHIRFIMLVGGTTRSIRGNGMLIFRSGIGWSGYGITAATGTTSRGWYSTPWISGTSSSIVNTFNGKTVKIVFDSDGKTASLYSDNVLIGTNSEIYFSNTDMRHLFIGGVNTLSQSDGDQCYNMTITGVRIYANA